MSEFSKFSRYKGNMLKSIMYLHSHTKQLLNKIFSYIILNAIKNMKSLGINLQKYVSKTYTLKNIEYCQEKLKKI